MTLQTIRAAAFGGLLALTGSVLGSADAAAEQSEHMPHPWQVWLQQPTSPVADGIYDFHVFLLWITFAIALFVLALMIYVGVKFRASQNPTSGAASGMYSITE